MVGRSAQEQPSLFAQTPTAALTLTEAVQVARPASPAHLAFRRLIGQIEAGRAELDQWTKLDDRLQQRTAAEIAPLVRAHAAASRQIAIAIDALLDGPSALPRLGRVQRTALKRTLLDTVAELLDDATDPVLVALHDKHADQPHAEVRQAELAATEAMLHDLFGLDLDADHGADSIDDLMRHAQDKLQQRAASDAAADEARRHARAARRASKGAAKGTERQTTQAARQQQQAEAEAAMGQSVRDVYRKLASVLHPDREPDADVRTRKTALMQRANAAYERRDLLTLLQLQLDAEGLDTAAQATLSDERLLQFNAVLRGQLREVGAELASCRAPYATAAADQGVRAVTPAFAQKLFEAELAEHRDRLHAAQDALNAVTDPARQRAFIAAVRRGGGP